MNIEYLEYEKCLICENTKRVIISKIGRNFKKLDTVMCTECGLIHSLPIPTQQELDIFYREEYRTEYKSAFKPKPKHVIRYASGSIYSFQKMMNYIKDVNDKKFLDIGSGSGEIIYFAKKRGFDVTGIEPHSGYANYCINELSLPVINQTYENAEIKKNNYDLIHLNEVLEHMRDPLKVLNDIYSFLKPGGVAFINVPNIELEIHAPNTRFHFAHIFNYNHITIKKIIEKCGFEILNYDTPSTSIVAIKNSMKNKVSKTSINNNFETLYNKLTKQSYLFHFLTFTPYWRVIKKIFLYPKEFIQEKIIFKDSKDILDHVYKKGKADLLVRLFKKIDSWQ